jgi:hypothetical protein
MKRIRNAQSAAAQAKRGPRERNGFEAMARPVRAGARRRGQKARSAPASGALRKKTGLTWRRQPPDSAMGLLALEAVGNQMQAHA